MTQLEYFEISYARYGFSDEEEDEDFAVVEFPNRKYKLNENLEWDQLCFNLVFSDEHENLVLADLASISSQLKVLADQVAQMEVDKLAEIERDGFVRTDIVGISKDSQPGEDIVPDEHDHNDMEHGGSDETSDDRGERERSNGQDEHEHIN